MANAQHWSTASAAPGNTVKVWADFLNSNLHSMELSVPEPDKFSVEFQQVPFGAAMIGAANGSAQHARRTPRLIARSDSQYYGLLYARGHPFRIQQYGRDVWVEPGQCAFYDSKEPYFVSFPSQLDCIGMHVAQSWFERWLPCPEDDAARLLDNTHWGPALGAVFKAVQQTEAGNLPLSDATVLDQVGALIALAAHRVREPATGAEKLVARIRASIKEQCQDTALTPDGLAQTHAISKRYLHLLLAQAGTRFGEELIAARLELARTFLQRPDFTSNSITDIALRSGFTAPGHFARRFRDRFGLSPTQFRQDLFGPSGGFAE